MILNRPFRQALRQATGGFLLAALCCTYAVPVARAAPDFSGQSIEWLVPFREGGGADIWARFNARFIAKYLPGQPSIVVRNVPGGGSTKGANRYAVAAGLDGLSLLGTSASTQFPYLLGDSRVRYDYAEWRILMVYQTGGVVYVRPELGISDASQLRDLGDKKLSFGSQGATSLDLVPMLGFELLGLNVRPIFGIRGRSAGQLAFERGDATIDYQTSAAYIRNIEPLVAAIREGLNPHPAGERLGLGQLGCVLQRGIRGPEVAGHPQGYAERYSVGLSDRTGCDAARPGIHRPKAQGARGLRSSDRRGGTTPVPAGKRYTGRVAAVDSRLAPP